MLQNATVKTKLTAGVGIVILSMLIGTLYSVNLIRGLTVVVSRAARIHQLGTLAENSSRMVGLSRAIVLHSIFDDKQAVEQFKKQFTAATQSFSTALNEARANAASETDKAAVEGLGSKQESWIQLHNEVMSLIANQQVDVAEQKVADPAFISKADEIRRLAVEMASSEAATLGKRADSANLQSLIGSAVLILASLGLGVFVLLYIRKVSGELFRLTVSLANNSSQVARLSTEVRGASESLANGSSQQAASLEQTAASTEEITTMTRRNAENSRSAAEVMNTVDGHVKASNKTLEEMVASMRDINASSDKISKIIKVIDEIAFQTNILALNAAVEAARAGQAGAGFAVVADEVRSLAQRSAQAAKDTAQLIEESINSSREGSVKLQLVTEGILAITADSSKVKLLVDEVNVASQEQARGIEQIAKAVAHMDHSTQGAAAATEQSAASSVQLMGQAEELNNIVIELRSLVGSEAA
jgi:methyl-accepting chemotaxis protein